MTNVADEPVRIARSLKVAKSDIEKIPRDHGTSRFRSEKGKIVSRLVVDAINCQERIVFDKTQERFYIFKRPLWELNSDFQILQLIDGFLDGEPEPETSSNILKKLKISNVGVTYFEDAVSHIPFEGGVLDIKAALTDKEDVSDSDLLCKHYRSFADMTDDAVAKLWLTGTLKAKFNSLSSMDDFKSYLSSTFKWCEEVISVVQEMIGYCMTFDTFIAVWFLLKGPGGNGKTVLLELLKLIWGELLTHMSFASFSKYSTVNLQGRLVSVSEELPRRPLDWDLLKDLTGGGHTAAERKFGPNYSFPSTAKMITSSNDYPIMNDSSEAFWQRIAPIPFPNSFRNTKKQILQYDKILGQEKDGIVYWGLLGLLRLYRRRHFQLPPVCEEMKRGSRLENDSIRSFLEDRCVLSSKYAEYSTDLYNAYKSYCVQTGIKRFFSHRRFLERIVGQGISHQREPNGLQPRRHYYVGVGYDSQLGTEEIVKMFRPSESYKKRVYWKRPAGYCEVPRELADNKDHCLKCTIQCDMSPCSAALKKELKERGERGVTL